MAETKLPDPCQEVGSVGYEYGIGEGRSDGRTVRRLPQHGRSVRPQPDGPLLGRRERRRLAALRPDRLLGAGAGPASTTPPRRRNGTTSPTASPTSSAPPASTTRSPTARCSRRPSSGSGNGFNYVTYKVRLSRRTGTGMYDMHKRAPVRTKATGFVIPSQNEWIKAAYYDPQRRRHLLLLAVPDQRRRIRPDHRDEPRRALPGAAQPGERRRDQLEHPAAGQLPRRRTAGGRPGARRTRPRKRAKRSTRSTCRRRPTRKPSRAASTRSARRGRSAPWGTLEQGGNAVEWTDTITAAPVRGEGPPRLAAPARRRPQRARLPALALGDRPAAAEEHLLRRHLPVARVPDRRDRVLLSRALTEKPQFTSDGREDNPGRRPTARPSTAAPGRCQRLLHRASSAFWRCRAARPPGLRRGGERTEAAAAGRNQRRRARTAARPARLPLLRQGGEEDLRPGAGAERRRPGRRLAGDRDQPRRPQRLRRRLRRRRDRRLRPQPGHRRAHPAAGQTRAASPRSSARPKATTAASRSA